jgi:hypothetical protein
MNCAPVCDLGGRRRNMIVPVVNHLQQIALRGNLSTHRLWVPSPLVREGQDEGVRSTNFASRPLTLPLSHTRGEGT